MDRLKSITIKGFKKFQSFNMNFNEHLNILVGENESGKSTLLEAIKVVLNQQYRTTDKSILAELFNRDDIKKFQLNPSIKTLPFIQINLKLELDSKHKNTEFFYGQLDKNTEGFGIVFDCKFDEELGYGLESEIETGKVPYEYYSLSWKTYAGNTYQTIKRPFGFLFIDTSNVDTHSSFNYYNKTLFINSYDDSMRTAAKNSFRDGLKNAFAQLNLSPINENKVFGIDHKKVILENIISVFENDIPLENKGSGMENLIKTQIALDKASSHLDVILMEEPENHLSFQNMLKMLKTIENKQNDAQIIIATHSNMIASRLDLRNVIWIENSCVNSLKNVDEKVAKFFTKADNNGFLQLLLSKKAILVEGATEYLLVPYFYEKIHGSTIESDGISIISCNGISYKNYLSIVKSTNKRIAVITDNDKKEENVESSKSFNDENDNQHIFMSDDTEHEWTWEAAFYSENNELLDQEIKVQNGAQYLFHKQDYGPVLGKMLNNKVEIAYQMLTDEIEYNIPSYIKDALKWIKE